MKKRRIITGFLIIALELVLFAPIPNGSYDDGGTREYTALTYKIVKWNSLSPTHNEDGSIANIDTYSGTSVYWFPNNFKSIDELWELGQLTDDTTNHDGSAGAPLTEGQSGETPMDNDSVEVPVGDIITDVATPNLNMRTLKSLVDRYGGDLTWSTFDAYYSEDVGSGLYALRYPIDEDYYLLISGGSVSDPPMYIHLVSEHDANSYIDIRTESIDDFINNK